MKDRGVNEGIYIQFENLTALGVIDVVSDSPITLSINGNKTESRVHTEEVSNWPNQLTRFPLQTNPRSPVKMDVKSVFVRIARNYEPVKNLGMAKIFAIRFYPSDVSNIYSPSLGGQIQPVLPTVVQAEVKASSILTPVAAYQPANLFDSKYDFAWSTYGEKTSGVGEWVELQFASPMTIAGLLVWNGYQRSESHFLANGRVASLDLSEAKGKPQEVGLKDLMGSQKIDLAKPLKNAKSLRLAIKKTIPGKNYPDILLSEIRLLDDKGNIIIPKVTPEFAKPSKTLSSWVDRSLSSEIRSGLEYDFKLRSDGSFAIFRQSFDFSNGETEETIWEGGWEEQKNNVRVFGKRYSSRANWAQLAYGLAEKRSAVEIFQTEIAIREFKALSTDEQNNLLSLVLKMRTPSGGKMTSVSTLKGGFLEFQNEEVMKSKLKESFLKNNAVVIESPLFSDVLIPSEG